MLNSLVGRMVNCNPNSKDFFAGAVLLGLEPFAMQSCCAMRTSFAIPWPSVYNRNRSLGPSDLSGSQCLPCGSVRECKNLLDPDIARNICQGRLSLGMILD